ncbi:MULTISPECIES: beta family protein [unclassified Caballeronia]|uniref:beta family protein n=1 Tax=unclassified Caballeronia TaxID=2646786 RepID=UPI0020288AA6|nr:MULTISPECIES: beta family protein [unclassified Caballeronia]
MLNLDFTGYNYYPTLRTRVAELKGLQMVDRTRKSRILPLLTLGKWPRAENLERSAEKAAEAMEGGNYFLDLPTDVRHHTNSSLSLAHPENAFTEWRAFLDRQSLAIPVVQFGDRSRQRDVIQQARHFERQQGKLAFRIRDFNTETSLVIAALSSLDDVNNAIVFVDAQFIRSAVAAYEAACTATINAIREQHPSAIISVLASSFPASPTTFADESQQRGRIDIIERTFHQSLGGAAVSFYGDYGSIHPVVYDDQPIMRWSPRIDYPLELEWYFERRRGLQDATHGYIDIANAILSLMPEAGESDVWGDRMIVDAASGRPHGAAPQSWIAVRVNLHLTRQIDFSERIARGPDLDEEEQIE